MRKRRVSLLWLGSALLGALLVSAVFAPLLAPYNPRLPVGQPLLPPGSEHLLGTNDLGQDNLSRLIHGARASLTVAVAVAAISTALSWSVGLVAGFFRTAEGSLMALSDLLLALPNLPLYMLVVTLVGPSRLNLVLVLSLASWPGFARVVRSVVIQTRCAPYIVAAHALGLTGLQIALRHVLPTTLDLLPTKLILTVRFAVFTEAMLAFLGLADSGTVSWGTMLSRAFNDPLLFSSPVWPWLLLPPAAAISALILATTWLASGRERLSDGGARR